MLFKENYMLYGQSGDNRALNSMARMHNVYINLPMHATVYNVYMYTLMSILMSVRPLTASTDLWKK